MMVGTVPVLNDYWEYIWNKPKAAGGFLWDLFDQGILRTDKDGEVYDTDGNHGADGIVGPNLEKEASYYAIREIWSPVKLEEREITPGWDHKLGVENRYIYTNLKECQFSFKLQKLHLPNQMVIQMVEVGTIPAPDLAPGEKGQLQIPVPANWADFDVMEITATDRFGKELYTWNYPLLTASAMAGRLMNQAEKTEKLQLTDAGDYLLIQGADVQFTIRKKNGLLQQVRNEKGIIPFTNGPDISAGVTAFKGLETKTFGKDSITITCHFQTRKCELFTYEGIHLDFLPEWLG